MKIDIKELPITKYIKPLNYQKIKIKSSNVTNFDDFSYLTNIVYKMIQTCLTDDGIGLAAPQIGIFKNIIIINDLENKEYFNVYINVSYEPIVEDGKSEEKEGCLSVPSQRFNIKRWNTIKVSWQTIENESVVTREEIMKGNQARILQHEYDHIHGRSIVERYKSQK